MRIWLGAEDFHRWRGAVFWVLMPFVLPTENGFSGLFTISSQAAKGYILKIFPKNDDTLQVTCLNSKPQIAIACSRKLLRLMYATVRNGVDYQPGLLAMSGQEAA